jgi:hypothetical protein
MYRDEFYAQKFPKNKVNVHFLSEDCEYLGIPGYETVLFGRWVQTFQRNILPPCSDEDEGDSTRMFLLNVGIYLYLPGYTVS